MEYGGTNGSPDIGPDWLGPNLSGTLTCALFQISFQQNMGEPTSSSPTESFLVPQSSYMTFELFYRYPPNGVWGNQRVLGGARKVLEEGGWSFPGLAQAPGSKHFNPLFYFLKKNTPLHNEDPSWMTPSTRQRTSPRRIWDAVGQNCTLTFSGLRGLFVNLILIDQGSIDFPYLADFQ